VQRHESSDRVFGDAPYGTCYSLTLHYAASPRDQVVKLRPGSKIVVTQRLWVQLPAILLSHKNHIEAVHIRASVAKQ